MDRVSLRGLQQQWEPTKKGISYRLALTDCPISHQIPQFVNFVSNWLIWHFAKLVATNPLDLPAHPCFKLRCREVRPLPEMPAKWVLYFFCDAHRMVKGQNYTIQLVELTPAKYRPRQVSKTPRPDRVSPEFLPPLHWIQFPPVAGCCRVLRPHNWLMFRRSSHYHIR